MGKVERIGSGIKRMRDLMKDAGLKEPYFEITSFFRSSFYRDPEYALKHAEGLSKEKTTQKTTQKIIQIIMKNPHITRKELADFIGITDDGIKYHLTNMQKEGLLRRVGSDKGGYWEVLK